MFGISVEHLLIVGVILIIVGPRRLPELGNSMGKAIKNFKDSFSGIEEASFKKISESNSAENIAKPAAPIADTAEAITPASKIEPKLPETNA